MILAGAHHAITQPAVCDQSTMTGRCHKVSPSPSLPPFLSLTNTLPPFLPPSLPYFLFPSLCHPPLPSLLASLPFPLSPSLSNALFPSLPASPLTLPSLPLPLPARSLLCFCLHFWFPRSASFPLLPVPPPLSLPLPLPLPLPFPLPPLAPAREMMRRLRRKEGAEEKCPKEFGVL